MILKCECGKDIDVDVVDERDGFDGVQFVYYGQVPLGNSKHGLNFQPVGLRVEDKNVCGRCHEKMKEEERFKRFKERLNG